MASRFREDAAQKHRKTCYAPLKRFFSIPIWKVALLLSICCAAQIIVTNQNGNMSKRNTSERMRKVAFFLKQGATAQNGVDGRMKKDSINSYWWPTPYNDGGGGFLTAIYEAQHQRINTRDDWQTEANSNLKQQQCNSSTKILVWRSSKDPLKDTRGLSAWAGTGVAHLAHALSENRKLVIDNAPWPMAIGTCDPPTRDCYFQPLSSCTYADADDVDTGGGAVVAVMDKGDDRYDSNVRTLYSTRSWWRNTDDRVSWAGLGARHNRLHFEAAAVAYSFRPQPWLQERINSGLQKSIPEDLEPHRTIGVPIRRSDKCKGHKIEGSAPGEQDCPSLDEYREACRKFLKFDPRIDTVIVTSEDDEAASTFASMMKEEDGGRLRVITNKDDVHQGTGSGNKLESYVDGISNQDVVASALTSLHMHLRAKYLVITTKSTWTSTIAILARVYGFASGDVLTLDLRPASSGYSHLAAFG